MKKFLLLIFCAVLSIATHAEKVTEQEAMQKAQQFLQGKKIKQDDSASHRLRRAPKTNVTSDAYYVFNVEDNEGFVIVSGDDRTEDILGYADKGAFDINNLPENMAYWLKEYERQIRFIQKNNITTRKRASIIDRKEVPPLLTTQWGQDEPFNNDCAIELGGEKTRMVTGCVATAMAQVMNYYKYPNATIADIPSYQITYTTYSGKEVVDFPVIPANTRIDWDNMKDSYEDGEATDAQKKAVAELMHYCGLSAKMKYSSYASGANSGDATHALREYFGYGPATRLVCREDYTHNEWDNLIYSELEDLHPVYYSGFTENRTGHAFVVDGYNAQGYYHINWGWGGTSNGYYLLSLLSPTVQGTGGDEGGYNFKQDAILTTIGGTYTEEVRLTTSGIALPQGDTYTRSSLEQDFQNVELSWTFKSTLADVYDIAINFGIYDGDNLVELINFFNYTFPECGSGTTSTMSMSGSYFRGFKGTYRIVFLSKEKNAENWNVNYGSDKYYFTAEITDTSLKLIANSPEKPAILDEERETLTEFVRDLQKQIQEKQLVVTLYEEKIHSAQSLIHDVNEQLKVLNDSVEAIRNQIENKFHGDERRQFEDLLTQNTSHYDNLRTEIKRLTNLIQSATEKNAKVASTLNTIVSKAEKLLRDINNIDTDLAYDEANILLIKLNKDLNNCDFSNIDETLDGMLLDAEQLSGQIHLLALQLEELKTEIKNTIPSEFGVQLTMADGSKQKDFYSDGKIPIQTYLEKNEIKSVEIGDSIISIGAQAFRNCSSLERIVFGNGVKEIYSAAFAGCENLQEVNLPKDLVNLPEALFYKCRSLRQVTLPTCLKVIERQAFCGCTSLSSLILPNSLQNIGYGAFAYCSSLKELYLPENLETIGEVAFYDCTGFHEMTLPEGLTSIAQGLFAGCCNITNLSLPSTITEICDASFEECTSLEMVRVFAIHVPLTSENPFLEVDLQKCILQVPAESIDKYQGNSPWKDFKRIEPLYNPDYTLTYVLDDTLFKQVILKYNDEIIPDEVPAKEGYTFSGWDKLPEAMPANDLTVTGSYVINQYWVTYVIDGEIYSSEQITYGSVIIPPELPKIDGCDVDWAYIPETMPAHDIVVYGSYETGISGNTTDNLQEQIFSISGMLINKYQQGLNIIVRKDGSVKRVFIK